MKMLSTGLWLLFVMALPAQDQQFNWSKVKVPGSWEESGLKEYAGYDGFAWLQVVVKVPQEWQGKRLFFTAGKIGDIEETYFNGEKIGAYGSMPPLLRDPASSIRRPYVIDPDLPHYGEWNLISIRVYNKSGSGGLLSGPIQISSGDLAIDLNGYWIINQLDDLNHASWIPERKLFIQKILARQFPEELQFVKSEIIPADKEGRRKALLAAQKIYENNQNVHSNLDGKGDPISPEKILEYISIPEFLDVNVAINEPDVVQPLFVEFDARGRMWVTQYIQYPQPAGIEIVTWDKHLRAIYDRDPPPPPFNTPEKSKFRGRDKITIHEDRNLDGVYEKTKVFMDGLNIVTSTAQDKAGTWILNPPYLLFVPDKNKDDIPDSDPIVHLSGFGLEDTHSVANSLKWGPDGWLYGVTGSTVTARIKNHFDENFKPLQFFGQTVWRYHPKRNKFELFAEGGWNNFGIEFDDYGRLFSGTNGGMQAVYFFQGGYYQKNFGKHGPHNNPYAFEYLNGLKLHGDTRRMVHQWIVYGGHTITAYKDKLIGVNPLANLVMALERVQKGSWFETFESEKTMLSDHKWFRPVHITTGPDGALFVSDFYDGRITHLDPRDNWDRDHGRIYRLQQKNIPIHPVPQLSDADSTDLVEYLDHPNKWYRDTARRLIIQNGSKNVVPDLKSMLASSGVRSLESLWVLHGLDAIDADSWQKALSHDFVYTRMWGIRLLADSDETKIDDDNLRHFIKELAGQEQNLEVLCQLMCSSRRIDFQLSKDIIFTFLNRIDIPDDDALPLLFWWAVEDLYSKNADELMAHLKAYPKVMKNPLMKDKVFEFLVRRSVQNPNGKNLKNLASLLDLITDRFYLNKAISGIQTGTLGQVRIPRNSQLSVSFQRLMQRFPDERDCVLLGVQLSLMDSLDLNQLFDFIQDNNNDIEKQLLALNVVSKSRDPNINSRLLKIVKHQKIPSTLRIQSLVILSHAPDASIGTQLIDIIKSSKDIRDNVLSIVVGFDPWALTLVESIKQGALAQNLVAPRFRNLLLNSQNTQVQELAKEIWGGQKNLVNLAQQSKRMTSILKNHSGDFKKGEQLFVTHCGACHRLGKLGGLLGPDLTGYERNNTDYLISAIVAPNLAVREEFELTQVTTSLDVDSSKLGQVYVGFVQNENANILVLKDLAGTIHSISKDRIIETKKDLPSLMPEGLLDSLKDEEIASLFKFLQH